MAKDEGGEPGWVDDIPRGAVEPLLGFLLYLALDGSSWPTPVKAVVAVAVVVLLYRARAVWKRRRVRKRVAETDAQSPNRQLTDLYRARGRIRPGWFVSFTGGPYPVPSDPRGRYITAMGEVVEVLPDSVMVDWRDRRMVKLPPEVPLWLLDDPRVQHQADGRWVTTDNNGFRPTHGGAAIGFGWNAHDGTYAAWSRNRVAELTVDDQRRFETEADLTNFRQTN